MPKGKGRRAGLTTTAVTKKRGRIQNYTAPVTQQTPPPKKVE